MLAASVFIDRIVARTPPKIRQSVLLMQAGQDRIIDNARTLAFFKKIASTDSQVIDYPDGHHTLEFDPEPDRYARDLVHGSIAIFHETSERGINTVEPTKRELRQLKRDVKRAGSQRRRRQWKRDLRENPEEAPYSEEDFGRFSTAALNGMDQDQTRRRTID